jgi:hypothetical protein
MIVNTLSYLYEKRFIIKSYKNIKFDDLINICTKYFGSPRIKGSHHIFKTPWKGDPGMNIQNDGNKE